MKTFSTDFRHNGVFPKQSITFVEFSEFSEFIKSLTHVLGSI